MEKKSLKGKNSLEGFLAAGELRRRDNYLPLISHGASRSGGQKANFLTGRRLASPWPGRCDLAFGQLGAKSCRLRGPSVVLHRRRDRFLWLQVNQ